ncbi:hypothetical protein Tco_0868436 [Tanacetum coccineum]
MMGKGVLTLVVPKPERPERVSALRKPALTTWIDPEDGIAYIDIPAYPPPAPPTQTPPSPEWSSGSLPVSPAPSAIPSPISSPMISLIVPSPIASPVATLIATIPVDEGQFIEIGAQLELFRGILYDHTHRLDAMPSTLFAGIDRDVRELYTRSGVVKDEIFSQRYRFRSLELEQERTAMTFGALWRPVLALEAWAGHVDTRMADLSWAGYNDHRLVHDMLVQQAALQHELHEMRGRVTALEQDMDRSGRNDSIRSLGESEETPLEETNSLECQCIELGNGTSLWRIMVEKFELNFGGEIPLRRQRHDLRECFCELCALCDNQKCPFGIEPGLVETDTESEPSEDPIDTETPESPHAVASPTSLPDSTPPTCHTEESEDSDTFGARSTSSNSTTPLSLDHPLTRTSPTPTPTCASFHQAMALSDSALRKRYISSYETSSSSSLALPVRKWYRDTSEIILDTDSKEDGIREEDTDEDEGHSLDDKGHGLDDEGYGLDGEGRSMESDGLGLEGEEEVVPEGQQWAFLVVGVTVSAPLGLGYGVLRHQELAVKEEKVYNTFEIGHGSGSVPKPERPKTVSALRQPTLTTWIDLNHKGHVDTRMADMSRAGYDDHRLVHDMLVQQAALQCELQEMRGHVTALEQEKDRRERR